MKLRRPGVAAGVIGVVVTLAVIPLAQAVTGSSTGSASRPRVVFRQGPDPGTFRIVPRPRTPLALVSVRSGDGQQYTVVSAGTDFSDPTVWLRMNSGTLCWAERPTRATRQYAVRDATVPFPAPRGAWAWSTIVLSGSGGPRAFASPVAGDVLSSEQRVRSVVVCVEPQFAGTVDPRAGRVTRADPPPPASTTEPAPTATDVPVVTTPTAPPTEDLPAMPPPEAFAKPENKITICHATNSTDNPYNLQTVDQDSIDNPNGHGTHTGPLFPEPGWGDVIPPFEGYPGMNWPAGSLLLEDSCELVDPPDPIDPPGIEIDPPDPTDPPGIDPPIVVMPPIYLPEPTPTPSVSATPTPSVSATPTPSVSATPTPSVTATPVPSVTAPPSVTATSPPQSTLMPAPTPTVVGPIIPARGEVAFTLTDGRRTFTVKRSAKFLHGLVAANSHVKCPSAVDAGRAHLRGC